MEKEEKVRSLNQNDVVAPSSRFTSFHSVLFFPFISMCSYYLSAFRKRCAVQDGSPKLSHHATENKLKKTRRFAYFRKPNGKQFNYGSERTNVPVSIMTATLIRTERYMHRLIVKKTVFNKASYFRHDKVSH